MSSFTMLFFSIFLPLYIIASVIFLIKMAHVTSVVQLSVAELTKLYLFMLPDLLFYTLPITFFIAAILSLYKFSTDNEMIVFFALGIKPNFLLRIFLLPATLLSLLLFFNSIILFPHAKTLSKNFLLYKKSEAKFNLSSSEFGHNFGGWLLYIGKENSDGSYGDVVLFHKDKKEELFITAKQAEIINKNGVLKMKLSDGEGNNYTVDTMSEMIFEEMYINDVMRMYLYKYQDPISYWLDPFERDDKIKHLLKYTLFSLFPLLTLFLILSIGITHDRHQKGFVYLYLFITILLYFGLGNVLHKAFSFYVTPLFIFLWLMGSYGIYHKKILTRF